MVRTCGISNCKNYGKTWDRRHHSMCPYCQNIRQEVNQLDKETKELRKESDLVVKEAKQIFNL